MEQKDARRKHCDRNSGVLRYTETQKKARGHKDTGRRFERGTGIMRETDALEASEMEERTKRLL